MTTETSTENVHADWDFYQRAYRDWQADAAALCNQMIGAQEWRAAHPESSDDADAARAWDQYAERLAEWGARRPNYRTPPAPTTGREADDA